MADTDPTVPFSDADATGPGRDPALPPGGRFSLLRTLGAGGMGVVIAAHDPKLDRNVALKLLRPDLHREDREHWTERLTLEAQAMARLAHPNVVTVYETVDLGEQLAIVMELVDGQNLRAWMAGHTDWREILAMLCAAGRGLAAAHAVGLIHRDFKPDNVLVGADGRARVTDFGLVTTGVQLETADLDSARVDAVQSISGNVVGTPAYMAPEQWAGAALDARTDQFAFCVTAWEALYHERPFDAAKVRDQRSAVARPPREAPPGKAPRWVEPVLRRGLSIDPSQRWPSMDALLAALDPARRRRRPIIAGAALLGGGAIAASIAWVLASGGHAGCPDPRKQLTGVWDPAVKATVAARFGGLGPQFAVEEWNLSGPKLDDYATAWSAMATASCKATRIDHAQTETVMELRTRCLDRRLAALRGLTTLLAGADVKIAVKLPALVDALPSIEDCGDIDRLSAYPLPAGAAARKAIDDVEAQHDRAKLARQSGDIAGAITQIDAAVARARELDYPPVLLEMLRAAAPYHAGAGDDARGVALLKEAIQVAAVARDDRAAAETWAVLLNYLGSDPATVAEATSIEQVAIAAATRVGSPPEVMVDLLIGRATVAYGDGRPEDAVTLLRDAVAIDGVSGSDQSEAQTNLAKMLLISGHPGEALPYAQQALATTKLISGPNHPWTADALTLLAQIEGAVGDLAAAEQAGTAALAIQRAAYGDGEKVATTLQTLANNAARRKDLDRATALINESIAIRETLGDKRDTAQAVGMLAQYTARTDFVGSEQYFRRALALFEEAGDTGSREYVEFAHNYAAVLIDHGGCDEALPIVDKLIAAVEDRAPGKLPAALALRASCQATAGDTAGAIASYQRAYDVCKQVGCPPDHLFVAAWGLGRALATTDRAKARTLVTEARTILAEQGPENADDLAQVDAWLAKH